MREQISSVFTLLLCLAVLNVYGQRSVGIGTTNPAPNAILHLVSPDANQGFLLPQLSTGQREAIQASSPTDDGLLVFDNTQKAFYYWKNDQWNRLQAGNVGSQQLTFNEDSGVLTISEGNSIDLSPLTNEVQELSLEGTQLTITGGNTLDISTINTDEQDLSLTGNTLALSNDLSSVDLNELQLSGDVTGTLGATSVASIQGNPVQSGLPTEGQVLKWQSGQWSPAADEVLTGGTAGTNTKHYSMGAATFREVPPEAKDRESGIYTLYGDFAEFGYLNDRDKILKVVGEVYLPDAVEVTGFEVFVYDNEMDGDVTIRLARIQLGTSTPDVLSTLTTSGVNATVQTLSSPTSFVIDNQIYTYVVAVEFSLGSSDYRGDDLAGILQRIYGARFEYTEPGNIVTGPGENQTVYVGNSAPSSPYTGQVWLNTSTRYLYFFNGTSWQQQQDISD